MDWMAEALCADDPEPDRWFPHQGQSNHVTQLKLLCGVCPVCEDCLLYALKSTEILVGVWGGTTSTERRELRRQVTRERRIKHGVAAYKTKACRCPICTEANAKVQREARKKRSLAPNDPRHGTFGGYANYNCRCQDCTEAKRQYQNKHRRRASKTL